MGKNSITQRDRVLRVLKDSLNMSIGVDASDLHTLIYFNVVDVIEEYNAVNSSSIPSVLGFHIASEVLSNIDSGNFSSWVESSRVKRLGI